MWWFSLSLCLYTSLVGYGSLNQLRIAATLWSAWEKLVINVFCFVLFLPLLDRKAIFFNSHNVSKPESSSDLTTVAVLVCIRQYFIMGCLPLTHCCCYQRENVEGVSQPPNDDVIRKLSRSLRQALGVSLFGIDVIINNQTGQHAVIDINAFPGWCPSVVTATPLGETSCFGC